jgi:hypothetical protein
VGARDLHNKRFGRLLVLRRSGSCGSFARWLCLCDCGKQTAVASRNLITGHTRSCGCLSLELLALRKTVHGEAGPIMSREYNSWRSMKARCLCSTDAKYPRYGGRGIKLCDRWSNSFENFLTDMGRCPAGLTLDRKDNDGDYKPDNCRWTTPREQANNTRRNRRVKFNGEYYTLSELARKIGWDPRRLWKKLKRAGRI